MPRRSAGAFDPIASSLRPFGFVSTPPRTMLEVNFTLSRST
jgi:hypothetical protein